MTANASQTTGNQPLPTGMGNEPPDMGGDVFEYKPAYEYAKPLDMGQYTAPTSVSPTALAAPTLSAMPTAQSAPTSGLPQVNMPTGGVPTSQGISNFAATTPTGNQALTGLQAGPSTGFLDTTAVQNQLMQAMTGEKPMAQLDPLMAELKRRQGLQADEFRAGQAARGIRSSTPGRNEAMDFANTQANQLANTYTQAANQLMGTQANVLEQLRGGQAATRGQQVNELMSALGLGENLAQGGFGRDLAGRQQGQSEQAQKFGQAMQRRQMEGAERQQQFTQEMQRRALEGDEGARQFLQSMQARQQGVGEQAQGFEQQMARNQQQFMQSMGQRGQQAREQAQRYTQQMGGRGQNFNEFMQMLGAQTANDQSRAQQGQQAISSMLQALGFNAGGTQAPQFGPGFMESAGTIGASLLPILLSGLFDKNKTGTNETGSNETWIRETPGLDEFGNPIRSVLGI
jgi:hypothetical protein